MRVGDYTRQQKSAMNLYKSYPKNPYYFWAVMSNLMQALHTEDEKKKNMFLNLAGIKGGFPRVTISAFLPGFMEL